MITPLSALKLTSFRFKNMAYRVILEQKTTHKNCREHFRQMTHPFFNTFSIQLTMNNTKKPYFHLF